jgi:DNA-binding response OmpR family regulator
LAYVHDPAVACERPTVLLADDNLRHRKLLRAELEEAGLTVFEAVDGVDAVDVALARRPRVCLIDINMPRQSGPAAAAVITAAIAGSSVILLTADITVADVIDALRSGAVGCMSKTVHPLRLLAAIKAVAAGESTFPRRELRQALELLFPG